VDGGGGNWPRFPGKFPGHTLRLCFYISLGEDPWFGWPTGVEDCSFKSPWGQADALGMYGQKLFWLGDFKFSFGYCTPAYRAPVLMALLRYIVRTDVGNRRVGDRLAASC
jgi:hypothetical protein